MSVEKMSTSEYLKKKIETLIPSLKNGMIPITIEFTCLKDSVIVTMKDLDGVIVSERILKTTRRETVLFSGIFLKLVIDGD